MHFIDLFVGFYCGAGFMCSLTVGAATVDGEKASWASRAFVAALWPYVVLTLGDQ